MAKSKIIKDGLSIAGHITRANLERVGSLLDSIEAKSHSTSHYEAVDLDNISTEAKEDLFRKQTVEASQQLIGPRFARYGKYAKKVVPDSVVQKTMDNTFAQIAKLAASWSQLDLPGEDRFANVQTLTTHERNALAKDVANQNRALATMGGVTGLAGLLGLFADTLWLLLVSLRSVYQLAAVYNHPLTGKQGVKMAYEILSSADLSKMQEKQALLAGIGVSKRLLENTNHKGFRNELKNAGMNDKNVQFYAEQVDKLAEQFNFDINFINMRWLIKLIPLASVGVGAYYNNHLINQVIGVAKATFGPEPENAKQQLAGSNKDTLPNNDSGKNNTATEKTEVSKDEFDTTSPEKKEDNLEDLTDDIKSGVNKVQDVMQDKVTDVKDKIDDAKTTLASKDKEGIKHDVDKAKDMAKDKVNDVKDKIDDAKTTLASKDKEDVKHDVDKAKDMAKDKVNDVKDKIDDAKTTLASKDKEDVKHDVDKAKDMAKDKASDVKDKIDNAKNNLEGKA